MLLLFFWRKEIIIVHGQANILRGHMYIKIDCNMQQHTCNWN